MPAAETDARVLATGALEWLLGTGRDVGTGLTWAATAGDDELNPTLYSGSAGIVLALLEGHRALGDNRYGDAAVRGARTVAASVEQWAHSSLYFGLTGMAFALAAVFDEFGDAAARAAADRALLLVRSRFDGERWSDQFELLGGNAGIALGALGVGDVDLAVLAVTPYLRHAEATPAGVQWEVRAGVPARFHHISHGTLGIVTALAAVGRAAARSDLIELALAGAADVVSRDQAGPWGFLVPHSDPQHKPELVERFSYGWCHGPAGDAQAFRMLAAVTGDSVWDQLVDRCWHTVTHSGLPQRLYPGLWDNSGRCCGTAGVLAFACDRYVERDDELSFANTLVEDLGNRAVTDDAGVRWSNVEHRVAPTDLAPRTGWAMGNAGIVRELLRFSRINRGQSPDYAVTWPDQPVAVRSSA